METQSRPQDCRVVFSTHGLAFRHGGMFKQTNTASLPLPPTAKKTPTGSQSKNTNQTNNRAHKPPQKNLNEPQTKRNTDNQICTTKYPPYASKKQPSQKITQPPRTPLDTLKGAGAACGSACCKES